MALFSFGSIEVDVYSDGELACPLLAMIPGADPAEFQRLGGCPDGEQLLMPMSSYLIRSGGKTLLVDTGVGASLGSLARAGFSGSSGLLPGALRDGGIDVRDIDAVIFTHLHTDHIGWNVVDRMANRRRCSRTPSTS